MECSYCGKQAIMTSGKRYCEEHIGLFEAIFFEQAVLKKFDSEHKMKEFFEWAFGSRSPKLSDLQKWHGRIERKEKRGDVHGIYEESQDCYICRIADKYLEEREGF